MKIDWKKKLASRKFWLAVVAFVTGIMVAFKVDAETVEAVGGLIKTGPTGTNVNDISVALLRR